MVEHTYSNGQCFSAPRVAKMFDRWVLVFLMHKCDLG